MFHQRFDQRIEPSGFHHRVVVDERNGIDAGAVTHALVAGFGEPKIVIVADEADPWVPDLELIQRAIHRAIVDTGDPS
ncbi:MAG: hypothetical protein R2735_14675 [Microthrixaceae bacterium]